MSEQLSLGGVSYDHRGWPPPACLSPILRWVGGKRWVVPMVGLGLHKHLAQTGGRYCEPFAGGAAVASWLGWPRTVLGELCLPIARCYSAVVAAPGEVSDELGKLAECGTDERTYYDVRAEEPDGDVEFAAWVLYLNATCYNGLWRQNRRGRMNVPWGKLASPTFVARERLAAWSERASGWVVHSSDFEPVLDQLAPGDACYCDPPYLDGTRGGYVGYTGQGWTAADRRRLAAALARAAGRGCLVLATDGASEGARADYAAAGLRVLELRTHHSVGARVERRGKSAEWVATSDEAVLG